MKRTLQDYNEFSNDIINNELVFLFGTGITSSLTGKPYGWCKWIADGIGHLKNKANSECLTTELQTDMSTSNMIYVAGKVIAAAKADDVYYNWMHESFETSSIVNGPLTKTLQKLVLSQVVFATTNYDLILEKATGLDSLSYDNPDIAFEMLDKHLSSHVIHVHGIYDSRNGIDNIVADNDQYNYIMENQGAQFIQNILGTRTLVFIGCGGTTEDPNISRFIEFANRYLKMNRAYYYLCKERVNNLPSNIKQIQFGDEYDDLPYFLEEIAISRLKKRIDRSSIVGYNVYDNYSGSDDSFLRYHFTQRVIPFCGRQSELNSLKDFIENECNFSWWAVTGQAGSGKSRLVFEFLRKLPVSWFGFFLNDSFTKKEIDSFQPFCNTLIVIDYVAGRERTVAEAIQSFKNLFLNSKFKIKLLLIERDNNRAAGSWYSRLFQRMNAVEADFLKQTEFGDSFIYLEDLLPLDVMLFITSVCQYKGVSGDFASELYDVYERKFERLKFRPLYVQLFVEAWVDNGCLVPQYDSYIQLIEHMLNREQVRWLEVVDHNQNVCNSFLKLMVRANISKLSLDALPDINKEDWDVINSFLVSHSFIGDQRRDSQDSLINYFCQNIDGEHAIIAPQFPDIIKEYMFKYYMDNTLLPKIMKEIWQNAASAFSVFIKKCMMDFPEQLFFLEATNTYQFSDSDYELLVGRLEMLHPQLIQKGEDPQAYWDVIDNEHKFWSALQIPEGEPEKKDTMALFKVTGLYRVAQHIGAWSLYDLSEMEEVIYEMLSVKGGKITSVMQKMYLSEHLDELVKKGFRDEAQRVQKKLDALVVDDKEINSLFDIQNCNNQMMTALLKNDTRKAKKILKEMAEKCGYNLIANVRMLARSCYSLCYFSMMLNDSDSLEVGYSIVVRYETLYPDDPEIRCRRIGCQVCLLHKQLFDDKITNKELRNEISKLEQQLSLLDFCGEEQDLSLEDAWGGLKCLKLNIASQNEIEEIINDSAIILEKQSKLATVVQTRISAFRALYGKYLHKKIPHAIVEDLYKYLEINPESDTVREEFFEMLKESEDEGRESDYLTVDIMREEINYMSYKPFYGGEEPSANPFFCDETLFDSPYERRHPKVGRNAPCPCGSGKKFKKCCQGKGIYD